jgi:hypothetical protein
VGIEPTTSPLPRECSTTELRQRPGLGIGPQRDRKVIPEVPAAGKASGLGLVRGGGSSWVRSGDPADRWAPAALQPERETLL